MNKAVHKYSATAISFLRAILKILLWVAGSVLVLLLLALLALRLPAVRDRIAAKASSALSEKLNTTVRFQGFELGLLQTVSLHMVYAEDLNGDTLLFAEELSADLDLPALLQNRIELRDIFVKGLNARVERHFPDTTYNYSFIIAAFAGEDSASVVADTSAAGWDFSIGRVRIEQSKLVYFDDLSGIDARVRIGLLELKFDDFDLEKSRITAKKLLLENSTVSVKRSEPKNQDPDTTEEDLLWVFGAGELAIHNTGVLYVDLTDSSRYQAKIGALRFENGEIDLGRSAIAASSLDLHRSDVKVLLPAMNDGAEDDSLPAPSESPIEWKIGLASLSLDSNQLQFDIKDAPAQPGFDYSHIALAGLGISASDVVMKGTDISVFLQDLYFTDRSGFRLSKLAGKMHYHDAGASVKDLELRTPHTRIGKHLAISYKSLDSLISAPAQTEFAIDLQKTQIGLKDLYFFVPALSASLNLSASEKILLDARVKGTLAELSANLALKWRQSSVKLQGEMQDLMNTEKMFLDLEKLSVSSGREDILALLPAGTMPAGISLPEQMTLAGNFKGYLQNFDTKIRLESSMGALAAEVEMDPMEGNVKSAYKASVTTTSLQLGALLNNKKMGQLTFSVALDGEGLDTSTFNTEIDLRLLSFEFMDYNYRDLEVKGHLLKSAFTGSAGMRDDNLAFDFNGLVNLDKTAPEFSFDFTLMGADLKKLHLSEEDMRLSAVIRADMALPQKSNPEGSAGIYDLVLVKDGYKHRVDSLVLTSQTLDGVSTLSLSSDKMTGSMTGSFQVAELGPSIQSYITSHFDLDPTADDTLVPGQALSFKFHLKDPAFLTTGLIPGLTKITPATVEGAYNSREKTLSAKMILREAVFNGIKVDSVRLDVKGNAEGVKYVTTLSQVSDSTNFKFENLRLGGEMKNDLLTFDFSTANDDSVKVAAIGGSIKSADSIFTLSFAPEVILNSQPWHIDKNNALTFGIHPLNISNLVLYNETQRLSVNHRSAAPDAPLEAVFKDFELTTLSGMMINNDLLVSGTVNGNVIIEEQNDQSAFRSDLSIRNLTYKGSKVGDLGLKADNFTDPSTYDILLSIVGNKNDVKLSGAYRTASKNSKLDFTLGMERLEMASIEAFTEGQVTQMTGWMAGELKINGDPASPQLKGILNMHELGFRPKIIDSYLRLHGGELVFDGQKVRMNKIVVFDTLNNRAELGGFVDISNLSEPSFDLKLKTKDFLAMNTDRHDNPLYFGRLFLDSDVRISGTASRPTIEAKARLNDKSMLTYVKPEDQILKNESEGVVEFTDSLEQYTRIMSREDSSAVTGIVGMELNAEITVEPGVEIKILVDPMAGDSLYISGGGRLNFTMDRNGSTGLSGKYNISKGGYFLTISDFVKRDFQIEKGSSVTWSGDPLDAYLDLSAIYVVKASPIDLIQDQMAGMTEQEANKYRNLLTFHVYLKMTGFLTSPLISFDIRLAPSDRGAMGGVVNSRLAQLKEDENQLNKQVFALLTLRRFVSENPLEGSGGGLSSAGRSSASKVLTQQLNTLSDRYVNFVDLDLGVNSYEDYSSGEQEGRTQVQVGVSKQLFDDRVTVRVGGNVDIEGEKASQNTANDVAGNISIDYKLTEDGRYKIKAFRENQYENPIEGEIIRTGAGFVFSRDFNKFKNIFRRPRSQRNAQKDKK